MVGFIDTEKGGERYLALYLETYPEGESEGDFLALCHASGGKEVARLRFTLRQINAGTLIGKGQLETLRAHVEEFEVELVMVGAALTPAQESTLSKTLGVRVIDRTRLILHIFALRAQSSAGKLQVELAQLEHLRSRLVRTWTHLERQKGGIGLRGPGEKQLETDRRLLGERVDVIRGRLKALEGQRSENRKRSLGGGLFRISLVGYTNAGKSTLFKALTGSEVFIKNQLFATLDPTTRRLSLARGMDCLLTDTVGFVQNLPHSIVDAFHATLEESLHAHLLLHVVDFSDPLYEKREAAVKEVLKEIHADRLPTLLVYNQIDKCPHEKGYAVTYNEEGLAEAVCVSATSGEGLEALQRAILGHALLDYTHHRQHFSQKTSEALQFAYAHGVFLEECTDIDENGEPYLDFYLSPKYQTAYQKRFFADSNISSFAKKL